MNYKNKKVPLIIDIMMKRINNNTKKNKVNAVFIETDHPLSTGWLLKSQNNICNNDMIFYSTLSLDFYFKSIEDNKIYTYQEKDGVKTHINNFFNKSVVREIKKNILTL